MKTGKGIIDSRKKKVEAESKEKEQERRNKGQGKKKTGEKRREKRQGTRERKEGKRERGENRREKGTENRDGRWVVCTVYNMHSCPMYWLLFTQKTQIFLHLRSFYSKLPDMDGLLLSF
jgi:hypothetical protein